MSELSSRGYECQQMSGDTHSYGSPEKRWLHYIVAVLVAANPYSGCLESSVFDTFRTLRSLIKVCQRHAPCASQVLYGPRDHRVGEVLADKLSLPAKSRNRCLSMDMPIRITAFHGVSWSSIKTPAVLTASRWWQLLTPQHKQLAAYSLCTDTSPVLLRDVSKAKARLSYQTADCEHASFAMTPGQAVLVLRDAEEPRLLLEEEALFLQGFPTALVSDLVRATPCVELADISGSMLSPVMLLVLLVAGIASVHWLPGNSLEAKGTVAGSQDASAAAFAAFSLLADPDRQEPDETPAPKRIKS